MTEEQKDWYEYGLKKYLYFALKVMNDPQYKKLAQRAWDARRKAHRWFHRGDCSKCRHCPASFADRKTWVDECYSCLYNDFIYDEAVEADRWEPKD